MITSKEDISRVFANFQDGTICGFKKQFSSLELKIDCYYLSKRINPEYECFYVKLNEPTNLEFEPRSEKGFPRKIISDLEIIRQWEYNIFTCEIKNGLYQIDLEIENPKTSLLGGGLKFDCLGINIYDQSKSELTFKQFIGLSI